MLSTYVVQRLLALKKLFTNPCDQVYVYNYSIMKGSMHEWNQTSDLGVLSTFEQGL